MDIIQIIVLAVLQGLTEFLPISSSGHLILPSVLFGWPDQGLAFDVATHMGTLTAVIFYFRKDIGQLTYAWILSLFGKGTTQDSKMAWFIIIATIPAVIFGVMLKVLNIDEDMRTISVIAATTLIFGALLGVVDYFSKAKMALDKINLRHSIYIGLAQMLALIPGTSRSGITITAALMLGFTREAAARFSFLLSIPVIIGASLLLSVDLMNTTHDIDWHAMLLGAVVSGLSALICIHLFLGMINKLGLMPFAIYRLALGVVLLWLL